MSDSGPFDPDLLKFLAELKRHNNKAWFEKNRPRYEVVYKEAFARFIRDFGPRLESISPELLADPRPTGGSVMRIFRDIRFSKDKSPYRTYTVVHFAHRGAGEGRGPGLFLFVSPTEISGGGGLWHPEPTVASRIRKAIVAHPDAWLGATAGPAFRRTFELTGESLKRPPPGISAEEPLIADLRRKDFVASTDISPSDFTSRRFLDTYEGIARGVAPLMAFLSEAIGLPF
jgi:uncharacterized protein (TIGR02453 family)